MISNGGMVKVFLRNSEEVLAIGRMATVPDVGEEISMSTGKVTKKYVVQKRVWQVMHTPDPSSWLEIDGNIVALNCDVWMEER